MSLANTAKMEVLQEMTTLIEEQGGDGMAVFAMNMQSMNAIMMYEKKLDELAGSLDGLFSALEEGEFTDSNGTLLTETITYQNLKKRLTSES